MVPIDLSFVHFKQYRDKITIPTINSKTWPAEDQEPTQKKESKSLHARCYIDIIRILHKS